MSEIIKIYTNNISTIINSKNSIDIAMPFSHQIYLVDAHIAGTNHIDNISELEPELRAGMKLKFFREPDNEYDKLAIVVKDEKGNKLGYIPKEKNETLSRLMDAGKLIYGTIYEKEFVGSWVKITIQVYLDD